LGRYGFLPRDADTWYEFRIDHKKASQVLISLSEVDQGLSYPVYYGLKEQLMDERGIFDVDKAEKMLEEHDPEIFEF